MPEAGTTAVRAPRDVGYESPSRDGRPTGYRGHRVDVVRATVGVTSTDDRRLDRGIVTLLLMMLAGYAVSVAALTAVGLHPPAPSRFTALLVTLVIPMGFVLARFGDHLSGVVAERGWRLALVAVASGVCVAWCHHLESPLLHVAAGVVLLWVAWRLARGRVSRPRTIAASVAMLVFGYGMVWNLNYLAARLTTGRVHDATLLDVDLVTYGWLTGRHLDSARDLFPLVDDWRLFRLLENAYVMLFTEVALTVFVLMRTRASLSRFFATIFTCYVLGVLVFLVYPTVGPCIYVPDSFRSAYQGTLTFAFMGRMANEYAAVLHGTTLNGVAYFVALPSLHVAMAVLLQLALARSPVHFWMMVPVNALLVASTVLLGYHYLLDVPAGIVVALVARAIWSARDA